MRRSAGFFMVFAPLGLLLIVHPQARADIVQINVPGNFSSPTSLTYDVPDPSDPTGQTIIHNWLNPYRIDVTDTSVPPPWPQTTFPALSCDDYSGALYGGEEIYASKATLAQLASNGFTQWDPTTDTGQKFAGDQTYANLNPPSSDSGRVYTTEDQYVAASLIANYIWENYRSPSFDLVTDENLTYALWTIFNPSDLSDNTDPIPSSVPFDAATVEATMFSYLDEDYVALRTDDGVSVPNEIFYTPCGPGSEGGCYYDPTDTADTGVNSGQELIGEGAGTTQVRIITKTTPEAPVLASLAFELPLAFGGILLLRRRMRRQ